MKRLRILLVVDSTYPSMGGAEMQARFLARVLRDAGHAVEVATARDDPTMSVAEEVDGVQVTRIPYPKVRLLGAAVLCVRFAAWMWRRRNEFDAVHVHIAKNLAAVAGLLRPFVPATLTIKISGAYEFQGGILDPARQRHPAIRMYNACIRRADTMQCISEYTLSMLRMAGYPPASLRLIPNAVDLSRFSLPPRRSPDGPMHFVFVGRIEPVKALDVLIDAWAAAGLAARARLTIAGYGSERIALMERARVAGVATSIDFPGSVVDVPGLLATADAYVQPSRLEGLSNSILEAMAMGLPIVATRISGTVDVVGEGDNGLLVPIEDVAALSSALTRLADDPALASRMGARSRQIAQARFSVPVVRGALEKAYAGEPA